MYVIFIYIHLMVTIKAKVVLNHLEASVRHIKKEKKTMVIISILFNTRKRKLPI